MTTIGDVTMTDDGIKMVTPTGMVTIGALAANATGHYNTATGINALNTITVSTSDATEDIMERWIMNRVTIDHKVQEHELMKLKEVAPDYANEIKENLAKNATRDIMKKLTFTKKHDKDADVHHFIGRAWVFTEEELKNLIKEVRNA